jgi:hypothetical protein
VCLFEGGGIILEHPESDVAPSAEQAPGDTGFVAVIDNENIRLDSANRAPTTLLVDQCDELLLGEPVSAESPRTRG